MANNSLLTATWDKYDNTNRNQVPTVFYGAHVRPGTYNKQIRPLQCASTLKQMYGLPKTGNAVNAAAIIDIWVE